MISIFNLLQNWVVTVYYDVIPTHMRYFAGVTETNQVVLLQEWTDAECLQGHYQSSHMEEFLSKLGLYLESEVITRTYASPDEPVAQRADARDEAERKRTAAAKAPQTIH